MAGHDHIAPEQVLHMARLSRLALSPEEQELFTRQFGDILNHMDVLNGIDVTGISPLYTPALHTAAPRQDQPMNRRTHEEILGNAPEADGEYFIVPRII